MAKLCCFHFVGHSRDYRLLRTFSVGLTQTGLILCNLCLCGFGEWSTLYTAGPSTFSRIFGSSRIFSHTNEPRFRINDGLTSIFLLTF